MEYYAATLYDPMGGNMAAVCYKPYFDEYEELDDGSSDDCYPDIEPYSTIDDLIEDNGFEGWGDCIYIPEENLEADEVRKQLTEILADAGHTSIWDDENFAEGVEDYTANSMM